MVKLLVCYHSETCVLQFNSNGVNAMRRAWCHAFGFYTLELYSVEFFIRNQMKLKLAPFC